MVPVLHSFRFTSQIYINNRDKQWIPSPHMPKALIERLNLRRANRFSIQSVSEAGQRSRVVDVLFEDVLPPSGDGLNVPASSDDGDSSSVVSGSGHWDEAHRRVVCGAHLSGSLVPHCRHPHATLLRDSDLMGSYPGRVKSMT